jgi:hypothetical protein
MSARRLSRYAHVIIARHLLANHRLGDISEIELSMYVEEGLERAVEAEPAPKPRTTPRFHNRYVGLI